MRINTLTAITAFALFIAYFGPIVIKLRDIPLTLVVIGGIVLVAVDIWQSLSDSAD